MKAKLIKPYRFSLTGVDIHTIEEGDVVEGEIAKRLVKQEIAKETKAKDAIPVFNDDGPIVIEDENVIESLDEAMAIIKEQSQRIDALEKQIEVFTSQEQQELSAGDENTESEETLG